MGGVKAGLAALCVLAGCAALAPAASAATYTNPTRVGLDPIVGAAGPFLPYPSSIAVAGQPGAVTSTRVTLKRIAHDDLDEVDVLLVGPSGEDVLLLSDTCSGQNTMASPLTFTFDDAAAEFVPLAPFCVSGTFRPTDYVAADAFPAPAPAGPYPTTLSTFTGTQPNGLWQLYVVDDAVGGAFGGIEDGWSLELTTTGPPAEPPAPVATPLATTPVVKKKCKKRKHRAAGAAKKRCKKKRR